MVRGCRLGVGDQTLSPTANGFRPPFRPDAGEEKLVDAVLVGVGLANNAEGSLKVKGDSIVDGLLSTLLFVALVGVAPQLVLNTLAGVAVLLVLSAAVALDVAVNGAGLGGPVPNPPKTKPGPGLVKLVCADGFVSVAVVDDSGDDAVVAAVSCALLGGEKSEATVPLGVGVTVKSLVAT